MSTNFKIIGAGALLGMLAFVSVATGADSKNGVAYPEGYRSWTHVKSMAILPGHDLANPFQGVHHIYAKEKALKGYATGTFPDGSVLVFDLLKEKAGGNALQEGSRKVLGVMTRSSATFGKTNGWGYEGFKGDSKTERLVGDGDMMASCHGCHVSQQKSDFVFSKLRK